VGANCRLFCGRVEEQTFFLRLGLTRSGQLFVSAPKTRTPVRKDGERCTFQAQLPCISIANRARSAVARSDTAR